MNQRQASFARTSVLTTTEGAATPAGERRGWIATALAAAALSFACGCGGAPQGGSGASAATPGSPAAAFEGTYPATWSGVATVNGEAVTGTLTGVITVTALDDDDILMAWQVEGNAPSGTITFAVAGNQATAMGTGTGGSCWVGTLSNGDRQTNCGTTATAQMNGDTLIQSQTGTLTGVTPDNVQYAGTYEGSWTGVRAQ
jgi:hypothetical protein